MSGPYQTHTPSNSGSTDVVGNMLNVWGIADGFYPDQTNLWEYINNGKNAFEDAQNKKNVSKYLKGDGISVGTLAYAGFDCILGGFLAGIKQGRRTIQSQYKPIEPLKMKEIYFEPYTLPYGGYGGYGGYPYGYGGGYYGGQQNLGGYNRQTIPNTQPTRTRKNPPRQNKIRVVPIHAILNS